MVAEIKRFRRKPAAVEADKAKLDDAEQFILALPDLTESERETVAAVVGRNRVTLSGERCRWWFTMLSPTETREAVALIHEKIDRRDAATRLFLVLLTHLEMDSGRVIADRGRLATDAFMSPQEVSRGMSGMARLGLVQKRGIGTKAAWFVNPRIAWRGSEQKRQIAVNKAVQLRLV